MNLTVMQRRPQESCDVLDPLRMQSLAGLLRETRPADGSLLELSRHDQLYAGGSRDRHIYVIEQGQIKTQVVAANGKRCLLAIHTEGDVVGETALLGIVRAETAVALTRTVVRRLTVAGFRAALVGNGLEQAFIEYVCMRLLEQQKVIVGMVTMSCELRLAVRLLDLALQCGKQSAQWVRIEIRFTHEDLAEMVGTTRTRVGQFLKRFRQRGLVELTPKSHLLIHRAHLADWIDCAALRNS